MMLIQKHLEFSTEELAEFCQRNHIVKLSFFGSIIREDFGAESDIDVLVEFEKDKVPGLIRFSGMEIELSRIFNNHPVDLNTPDSLSPYFKNQVLDEAETLYVKT